MSERKLSELWRFPVKSLRGRRFSALAVTARGFAHDREWMVVDPAGRFLTQRQQPRMALVDAAVRDGQLQLAAPGMPSLDVAAGDDGVGLEVQVWGDRCAALAPDPAADAWLSRFLDAPCRLVRQPADAVRRVDPGYAGPGDQVGFADGFPFLLISQASLDDLNRRLASPVPMLRFRPNLVVTGTAPYEEDRWRRIRIGDLTLRVAKPCSRCVIPTIDPATAERAAEPLRTLMSYRRRDNKVYFGQNLLHDGVGRLAEGMVVEVLEWADD
jgi:uncharacterized protein YcbX